MNKSALKILVMACLISPGMLVGCNKGCTEIGCYDGLSLELASPLAANGEIRVAVTGDVERQCTQLLSSDMGACRDLGLTFERSADGRLIGVNISGVHPNRVALEIASDGTTQRSDPGSPEYQELQPNGTGCPPTCRSGKLIVKLAP